MTRFLLLLPLAASMAFGQTYVRPSKGAPINVFPTTPATYTIPTLYPPVYAGGGWVGWPTIDIAQDIYVFGPAWDWSAFEAMRVRVYGTGAGTNTAGALCIYQSLQWTVTEIGPVARVQLVHRAGNSQANFAIVDSATTAGPWYPGVGTNAQTLTRAFNGCPITILVTPIPFIASTSVSTGASTILPDGGISVSVSVSNVAALPYPCGTASVHNVYLMDGGAQSMGTLYSVDVDGGVGSPTSSYVIVCNSKDNSGTANIRCRDDAVDPTLDAGTPGTVLGVGDCVPFTSHPLMSRPLLCVGTSNYVSTYECAP